MLEPDAVKVARPVLRGARRGNALGLPGNRVHYIRDVTFDEDHSQVRKKSGPRVMASLRNLATAGETNIARGLRSVSRDPMRSLTLFGL